MNYDLYKYEYIWLDGYTPEPNLRSKTKILATSAYSPDELPEWFFDGSSTKQAEGNYSDCKLKPVYLVEDPEKINGYLVMCEVLNIDNTPHESNTRAHIPDVADDAEYWFGFEQEYTIVNNAGNPVGSEKYTKINDCTTFDGYKKQGEYYCGVGKDKAYYRELAEAHLEMCLMADLGITGINAEVCPGQWEFQLMRAGKEAGDALWIARYLLLRLSENYEDINISFYPKIVEELNGSGLHTNFSNTRMREVGGLDYFKKVLEAFKANHVEHINEYGSDNQYRLTGEYETASINEFKVGVSDRGASIRIPQPTHEAEKGYLEDRRPASNADPYRVIARIVKTMEGVK